MKQPKYYDVKLEATIPAVLHYRVLANSPEEAVELIKKTNPNNIQYHHNRRRNIKAVVYDLGTVMIKFIQHFHRI